MAEANLGFMYQEGRGVPQDDAEAAKWYRKAAERGNAHSQTNLGSMYQEGRGVSQHDAEAARTHNAFALDAQLARGPGDGRSRYSDQRGTQGF